MQTLLEWWSPMCHFRKDNSSNTTITTITTNTTVSDRINNYQVKVLLIERIVQTGLICRFIHIIHYPWLLY